MHVLKILYLKPEPLPISGLYKVIHWLYFCRDESSIWSRDPSPPLPSIISFPGCCYCYHIACFCTVVHLSRNKQELALKQARDEKSYTQYINTDIVYFSKIVSTIFSTFSLIQLNPNYINHTYPNSSLTNVHMIK